MRLKHIYNFKPILYKYIIFIAPGSPNQCGTSLTHLYFLHVYGLLVYLPTSIIIYIPLNVLMCTSTVTQELSPELSISIKINKVFLILILS